MCKILVGKRKTSYNTTTCKIHYMKKLQDSRVRRDNSAGVCVPPEDDPEIRSKSVDGCVDGTVRIISGGKGHLRKL